MDQRILVINPPSKDKNVNRDMAGGLGFSGGEGVILPPLDLLSIVTSLRDKNDVFFIDAIAEEKRINEIFDFILDKKIDLVIGNLSLPTITEDISFYKKVKNLNEEIRVLVKTGINYEEILSKIILESGVDLVIFSECDFNIIDYIKGEEKSGTVKMINGKIIFNKILERESNLDLLPIPSRDLLKNNLYSFFLLEKPVTTIQTTRGCPYPCGYYCPYPLVQGTKWRYMSAERVLEEIKSIVDLGIKNILFRDATFTLDKKRILEICNLIIKDKLKIKWWCETRINLLDEELLLKMKKSGCVGINVGVETLDGELIKKQGKPGVSLEDVVKIRELARKINLKLHFLMIIGLPDENLDTLKNTFEYFIKLRPESAGFTLITPYPGTRMFDEAKKRKLIRNFDWNSFDGATSNMRTKYLTETELKFGRFLLQISSFLNKKDGVIKFIGLNGIRFIFKIWEIIKRRY